MALAAGAIILIIGARITNWYTHALKAGQKIKMDGAVNIIQHRLNSAIDNDVAWALTVASGDNPAMACFRSAGQDCSAANSQIAVYSINGVKVSDQPNRPMGFSLKGEVCSTFDAINGNDDCPFQLNVFFRAICPTPPCFSVRNALPFAQIPPVEIDAKIAFKPQNPERFQAFNHELHRLVFTRGHKRNEESHMASLCGSFDGIWDPVKKRCNVKILNVGVCPPNFHLAGVDPATGGQHCKRSDMTNVVCRKLSANPNRGTAIVGFAEWGEPICGKFEK